MGHGQGTSKGAGRVGPPNAGRRDRKPASKGQRAGPREALPTQGTAAQSSEQLPKGSSGVRAVTMAFTPGVGGAPAPGSRHPASLHGDTRRWGLCFCSFVAERTEHREAKPLAKVPQPGRGQFSLEARQAAHSCEADSRSPQVHALCRAGPHARHTGKAGKPQQCLSSGQSPYLGQPGSGSFQHQALQEAPLGGRAPARAQGEGPALGGPEA